MLCVELGLRYGWKGVSTIAISDAVTGIHHTRDGVYLLSDTPREVGNNMGFTQDQVAAIFKTITTS